MTTAKTAITTIATNVCGALWSVFTAKNAQSARKDARPARERRPAHATMPSWPASVGAMKGRRLVLLVGVTIGSLLALAGCGGGGSSPTTTTTQAAGTSTADWANGFCTAVSTWKTSVKNIGAQVASSPSKASLEKASSDFDSKTKTLVSDLKGLGKLDTPSGQQAKNSVDKLVATLQSDLSKIEQTVKGVSGVSGLVSAAATLSGTLTSMEAALTSTLHTIQNADVKGELSTAFDQAPACKGLTSSK